MLPLFPDPTAKHCQEIYYLKRYFLKIKRQRNISLQKYIIAFKEVISCSSSSQIQLQSIARKYIFSKKCDQRICIDSLFATDLFSASILEIFLRFST